jgi:hypothetical protein
MSDDQTRYKCNFFVDFLFGGGKCVRHLLRHPSVHLNRFSGKPRMSPKTLRTVQSVITSMGYPLFLKSTVTCVVRQINVPGFFWTINRDRLSARLCLAPKLDRSRSLSKKQFTTTYYDRLECGGQEVEVSQPCALCQNSCKALCPSIADSILAEIEVSQRCALRQHWLLQFYCC